MGYLEEIYLELVQKFRISFSGELAYEINVGLIMVFLCGKK